MWRSECYDTASVQAVTSGRHMNTPDWETRSVAVAQFGTKVHRRHDADTRAGKAITRYRYERSRTSARMQRTLRTTAAKSYSSVSCSMAPNYRLDIIVLTVLRPPISYPLSPNQQGDVFREEYDTSEEAVNRARDFIGWLERDHALQYRSWTAEWMNRREAESVGGEEPPLWSCCFSVGEGVAGLVIVRAVVLDGA